MDKTKEVETTSEGIVTDCLKVNIREKPKSESNVIGVIPSLSQVLVYLNESTSGWYKICTSSGVEGYCKKKFIAVK